MLRKLFPNLAESSLNALHALSLFPRVFMCIYPAWPMGAYGFCLNCSGYLGDKFSCLFLMIFGERIVDLCEISFVGAFQLLGGIVYVWIKDSLCIFLWTTSFDFSLFVTCHWGLLKFGQVKFLQVFLKFWPQIQFQLDQSLYQSSIFVVLINWNGLTLLFSWIPAWSYSACVLLLFFFFFIDIPQYWVSWMVL